MVFPTIHMPRTKNSPSTQTNEAFLATVNLPLQRKMSSGDHSPNGTADGETLAKCVSEIQRLENMLESANRRVSRFTSRKIYFLSTVFALRISIEEAQRNTNAFYVDNDARVSDGHPDSNGSWVKSRGEIPPHSAQVHQRRAEASCRRAYRVMHCLSNIRQQGGKGLQR